SYDVEDYKGRNVVERSFNEDKQWRGIATRYDCEDVLAPFSSSLTRGTTDLVS
ncbi:transposase, partial [Arthrobacter sp. CAN_A2]